MGQAIIAQTVAGIRILKPSRHTSEIDPRGIDHGTPTGDRVQTACRTAGAEGLKAAEGTMAVSLSTGLTGGMSATGPWTGPAGMLQMGGTEAEMIEGDRPCGKTGSPDGGRAHSRENEES